MPLFTPPPPGLDMAAGERPSGGVAIVGAGVIGLCTAYFLSESGLTDPRSIHVVDSSAELFRCASGLAAGFLAADWFAPSVSPLGALSFRLHAHLAKSHGGRQAWGYAPSTGISLSQDSESAVGGSGEDWLESGTSRAQLATHNRPWEEETAGPKWLRRTKDGIMEAISRDGTTAQLDPLRFCKWLLKRCRERGVHMHHPATVLSVAHDQSGALSGLCISKCGAEFELPCTRLVLAAGAWTPRVFAALFPTSSAQVPIRSLAGHSLLVRNPHFDARPEAVDKEKCHAVFATDTLGFSPEWFARVGGELYLAGLNSMTTPLPESPEDVQADPQSIQLLRQCASIMMPNVPGSKLEVLREGLCFRPITPSGRPIVSRVPDQQLGHIRTRGGGQGGVFIAAGHGAWGISHAPGTGMVMAELLLGRRTSVNIDALRFPS